jgi:23S rRNA pseudouridine1911/1915/1917 synthase
LSNTTGERLDHYLVRTGHAASRRDAREMVARGAVLLNGRRGLKGAVVRAGDNVEVEASPALAAIEPDSGTPIEVLFEDPALVVVNKPGGVPCHPLKPGERGTVMNAIVARFPETAVIGDKPIEGGLIHRLDNGTSGALMIARTADAFALLRSAIRSGAIKRRYLALVSGNLKAPLNLGTPIAHHPKNPRKMIVVSDESDRARLAARPAVTRIEPIRRVGNFTLVSVTPSTGVRHQIRVHLASAGFPMVGDDLYGGAPADLGPGRFWLHLSEIEFESPASGAGKVPAPLTADLARLLSPQN